MIPLDSSQRQDGNPVVKYSHFSDKNTWKAEFFGPQPEVRLLRESSPLTRTGNLFRFVHRSMLEYFLSRAIYNPINMTDEDDFQAIDEPATPLSYPLTESLLDADGPLLRNLLTEPSIIQFLCDRVKLNYDVEQQLRGVIHRSKIDATAAIAATNAITILVQAGVDFNGADLQGVKIPGADLFAGQFDSAQLQGADLTGANLSRSWLREADLSNAQMEGVRFGEHPYLEMNNVVRSCAYSPDRTMLAVGLQADGLDVYNIATWTRVFQVRDEQNVFSAAFSLDNQQIVFGGEDRKVRLFYSSSSEVALVMEGHTDDIFSVAFSLCGKQLASGDGVGSVRLWNSQTGESCFVVAGLTSSPMSVKFSPDGRQLVSGSWDGTIRFWDSKTGEPGLVLDSLLEGVGSLAYSHDGRWIVSSHYNGALKLWETVSGEPGPVLRGHTDEFTGIAFSLDDQLIASSSYDLTVRLWDSSTGVCISILTGHGMAVCDVAFSPDDIQLAWGGYDKRVRLWDISSIGWSVELQEHHFSQVDKANYSSKDLFLLSTRTCSVQHWDPAAGKPGPFVFTLPKGTVIRAMMVSPDGNQIAVGTAIDLVQLWDRRTGTVGSVLEGHKFIVDIILYSPCGRWLLTHDYGSLALLWDLHGTKQESHVRADVDVEGIPNARRAAFSSLGCQFAICYEDNFIRIFDLPSRSLVKSKNLKREGPYVLTYSPNGQQSAIGSGDGSIYLWDLDQPEEEELSAKLSGHQNMVHSVAYSPCGHWIASGSSDQTVRLWHLLPNDPESWPCVAIIRGFEAAVTQIAWSPVTLMEFVTHCDDKSVRIWRVSNNGGKVIVRMQWGSYPILCAAGLVLENTSGLTPIQQKPLIQRGAVDSSIVHEGDKSYP